MWGQKCSGDQGRDKARAVAVTVVAPGMMALLVMALVMMTLMLTLSPPYGKGESKAWMSSGLGFASALPRAAVLCTTDCSAASRECWD